MTGRLCAFCLLTVSLFPVSVSAQTAPEDSSLYRAALAHTVDVYYRQLGDQSLLYNGKLYGGYGFAFKEGIPYFLSAEFRPESLVYDGIRFDHVPILYDDLSEAVISKDQGYWLQLVNAKVSSFTVAGHHFVRLVVDSLNRDLSGTGYYEVLYQGHSTVFKKTIKKIKEDLSVSEGIQRLILVSYRYYIRMGNAYFPVRSKKEIRDVFSDHRKEIQQFMRKNKLKFRKDKDRTLIQLTAYYDQLTK
ncbi:MAG TPA: hypothetical protein VHC50_03810 [Puia sp.]|jgi:predicted CopG family antitoxin|nr:hypothetical protein [Puia sp.]